MLKFIPVRGRKRLFKSPTVLIDVEIYPREGTETSSFHFLGASPLLKFIPVRGRKHFTSEIPARQHLVEIYPREGTETSPSLMQSFKYCWNLSPWGDGNVALEFGIVSHIVEIYPREGTETPPARAESCCRGWNLSPWGDGNSSLVIGAYTIYTLKFIPVRGRKLVQIFIFFCQRSWNLSPWGDGNSLSHNFSPFPRCWNLSLWGDGNR